MARQPHWSLPHFYLVVITDPHEQAVDAGPWDGDDAALQRRLAVYRTYFPLPPAAPPGRQQQQQRRQ